MATTSRIDVLTLFAVLFRGNTCGPAQLLKIKGDRLILEQQPVPIYPILLSHYLNVLWSRL
jgi:hypothetical protein